jgi:hypothetical protein
MSENENGSRHEEVDTRLAVPIEEQEPEAQPLPPSITIVVQEADLQVLFTPTAPGDEPDLDGGTGPAATAPVPGTERLAALQGRLEQVEQDLTVVLDEVSSQREELRHAIDEGFRRLQETLTRLRVAAREGTEATD